MKKGWKLILSIYGCILIMTVILLSIFGNYQRKMAKQDLGVIDDDIDYKYHFVFISGQKNVSFWNGIYMAAKDRGKELGIYVEQLGSLMTEGYSIEEQLEIAIASKVDGIMIEPNGGEEVIRLINQAGENNIPVVMVSRCPTGRVLDTYGYEGGGKHLRNLGVIFGGDLPGQKARIKLMLVLSITRDIETIRNYFER